jgi:hypothetical protein
MTLKNAAFLAFIGMTLLTVVYAVGFIGDAWHRRIRFAARTSKGDPGVPANRLWLGSHTQSNLRSSASSSGETHPLQPGFGSAGTSNKNNPRAYECCW